MKIPFCYIENEIHALGLGLWGRLKRLNDNLPVVTKYQKRELFNATLNDPDRQIIIINTCGKENLFDDIDKARQFLFHCWKYLVYATLIPMTSENEIISLGRSVMGVDYDDAAKVLRKNENLYYALNARFRNKTISIQDKRRIWPIYKALEVYLNIPPQNIDDSIEQLNQKLEKPEKDFEEYKHTPEIWNKLQFNSTAKADLMVRCACHDDKTLPEIWKHRFCQELGKDYKRLITTRFENFGKKWGISFEDCAVKGLSFMK